MLPSPTEYEFFQAVRLLRLFLEDAGESTRPFLSHRPDQESIRFSSDVSKSFPSANLVEYEYDSPQEMAQLTISFFGLHGALAALPWADVERAINQSSFRQFLDVFNHRLVSLFYRAWEKNRFFVPFEREVRADTPSFPSDLVGLLLSQIGLGTSGQAKSFAPDEKALLRHLMVLSGKHRSSSALECVLQHFFPGNAFQIYEFEKSYLMLRSDQVTRFGGQPGGGGQLGLNTMMGDRIEDYQSRFRILIGPISFTQFQDFLPDKKSFSEMRELVKFVVGIHYDVVVQFEIEKSGIPSLQLQAPYDQFQLGQNMWLSSQPFESNRRDPVFSLC